MILILIKNNDDTIDNKTIIMILIKISKMILITFVSTDNEQRCEYLNYDCSLNLLETMCTLL